MQNVIFLFSELLDSAGVIKSNPPRYRKVEVVCVYLLENKNYMNVIVFFLYFTVVTGCGKLK